MKNWWWSGLTVPEPEPTEPGHASDSGGARTVCEVRGLRVETGGGGDAGSRLVREVPGGPTLVEGPVELVTPNGDRVYSDRFMVAVCACRRSKNYPLCDTSHRRKVRPD